MTMSAVSRATWQIHFCVVLWGFTAILGKLISLGTLSLVWWRMVLVTGALVLVPRFWRGLSALSPRLIATYAGIKIEMCASDDEEDERAGRADPADAWGEVLPAAHEGEDQHEQGPAGQEDVGQADPVRERVHGFAPGTGPQ